MWDLVPICGWTNLAAPLPFMGAPSNLGSCMNAACRPNTVGVDLRGRTRPKRSCRSYSNVTRWNHRFVMVVIISLGWKSHILLAKYKQIVIPKKWKNTVMQQQKVVENHFSVFSGITNPFYLILPFWESSEWIEVLCKGRLLIQSGIRFW